MAGTINTQAQLQVSSSATYTTNAANLITAALVRTLNENWISSSVVIPMTASMTVLSSSYAATASVLIGTVVSASYAYTASSAISSSFAETASFVLNATPAFPFTGSAAISGSLTVTGSITSNSGNIAGTTTVGNGGTSAVTIGGAINSSGIISSAALSNKLDTAAGTILGQFALTGSGALQIGTFSSGASGDIRITPNGITARNSSGTTTFSLDGTTGNAVFAGQLSGASGTFSGNISGASGTFQGAISSNSVTATGGNIGGFTIGAAQLYTGSKSTFGSNNAGVYVGNDGIKLGSAFYVDTNGSLTASSITATGSITSTSGNIAGTTTVGNGSTTAVTVGGAINAAGNLVTNLINSKLDTSSSTILSSFVFEASNYAGALKAGDITWNTSGAITGGSGIVINAKGIIGAAAGVPTFSIDSTTGAATFGGTLSAPIGSIGGLTIASSRLHSGTKTSLNDTINGFYLGTDGVSLKGGTGAAALEIVGGRGRFTTRNTANEITGSFQGEDGATGGSFLFLANSTGVDTISFFGQSGFGYFSTFYDKNDTNYYCNPASTSVFAGLDVGGYAVLTTNSGAVTAGASTNFGQLQVNDWLTFDNSQTRLSISKDFNLGSENYLTYAGGDIGHRWVNSGNTTQLALLNNSGDLSVTGALSKGSGSFRIEHPLPSKAATHELVHSFIEGPRCGLIYSGKINLVNGIATINIDADSTMTEGTFEVLCKNVHCFTTNETGWGAIRGKVVGNILTIEAQDLTSTDSVSWMVIAERKDKHIMDTDWTDENGRPIVEPLKKVIKDPLL